MDVRSRRLAVVSLSAIAAAGERPEDDQRRGGSAVRAQDSEYICSCSRTVSGVIPWEM